MPVKRDDETFTEFTLRLAREEWTRPMQDEIVRLRAENERLRHGFCDEAHILMVQALDVKALGKGRRAILTEQDVKEARALHGLLARRLEAATRHPLEPGSLSLVAYRDGLAPYGSHDHTGFAVGGVY